MDGINKLLTDFIIAMAVKETIERYKDLGITVEINVKNVDYDHIYAVAMKKSDEKAAAEAKAKEDKSEIESDGLRDFFNAKYKKTKTKTKRIKS